MNIYINAQVHTLTDKDPISMSTALGLYFIKPPQSTFAIALNGDFIGKADYPHTFVKSGDSIDILQPIQGG